MVRLNDWVCFKHQFTISLHLMIGFDIATDVQDVQCPDLGYERNDVSSAVQHMGPQELRRLGPNEILESL